VPNQKEIDAMSEVTKKEPTTFERLAAIDVSQRTEKKQGLTYLSWAWAWDQFKRHCPDATYEIWTDEQERPYMYDNDTGYMVRVTVTACGESHMMWLPVMDGANKAQKNHDYTYTVKKGEKTVAAATMFDINKALMRCLVKCLAMFGLGLFIYAGEDMPELSEEAKAEIKEEQDLHKVRGQVFVAACDKYEFDVVQQAFADVGYTSSFVDAKDHIRDLVKQVDTSFKLKAIGESFRVIKDAMKKDA